MKKNILILGLGLLLTSCAFHGAKLERIGPGMSKADVIKQLGKPTSIGGHDNVQVLHYQEDMGSWRWSYHFVRLVDGKVESYGPENKQQPVTK